MADKTTKSAKDKLGSEKYNETLDKEWKVTEVPEGYENKRGKDGRKLNPKSLQNLTQYRKRSKEEKEIALSQLRYTENKKKEQTIEIEEDLDSKTLNILRRLKKTLPMDDIFHDHEVPVFVELLDIYLRDFEEEDLSATDLDDIISIAMNRVMEVRLLKHGKEKPTKQLDTSQAIERLRKNTEKLKEHLSARRKDRMKHFGKEGFTIVDLVALYENSIEKPGSKDALLRLEEQQFLKERVPSGNKEDPDAVVIQEEEDM